VSSFQFSFHWGTNIASYVTVEQFGLLGMTTNIFGVFSTGTVTVAWEEPNGGVTNLADGSTIFGVRFQFVGTAGSNCPVTIDSTPTAFLAGDENLMSVPVANVNSLLSIDHTLIVTNLTAKIVE